MSPPVAPYYETADLEIGLQPGQERAMLRERLERRNLDLILLSPDGERRKTGPYDRRMTVMSVAAALLPLVHDRPGAELDLLAKKGSRAITVWFEPGAIVLAEANVTGSLYRRVPNEADLRKRWDLGPLVSGERTFDPLAYGLLDQAMASLEPGERALVQDLTLRRDARSRTFGGYQTVAAVYTSEGGGRIEIYDDAFVPTIHFVGSVADPKPFQLLILVHELGHAVQDAPARFARASLVRLEAEYEEGRAALAALGDPAPEVWEPLVAEANLRVTRAEAVSAWLRAPSPVLEAWLAAKDGEPAATTYGRHAPVEGFAEEFALFRTDPAALDRASPRAAAWFRSGGHLTAATVALDELKRLAGAGGDG